MKGGSNKCYYLVELITFGIEDKIYAKVFSQKFSINSTNPMMTAIICLIPNLRAQFWALR